MEGKKMALPFAEALAYFFHPSSLPRRGGKAETAFLDEGASASICAEASHFVGIWSGV